MARLLANENIPAKAVAYLRAVGHDIEWGLEMATGSPDDAVLDRACVTKRALLTQDRDFGRLARQFPLKAASGIILIRLPAGTGEDLGRAIDPALKLRESWDGLFAVVSPGRVRVTPIANL